MAKIVFTANWDWVLFNFRCTLARALRDEGHEIVLVCPRGRYIGEWAESDGFRWVEWPLRRRSLNPLREVAAVHKLARIYRREKPDVIHQDTIKPNLYGSLATLLNRFRAGHDNPPPVLSIFMGIGFLFSNRIRARLLRPFVLPIMRLALGQDHVRTVFSNRSDRETFVELGLAKEETSRVMVSEFVDTSRFRPLKPADGPEDDGGDEAVVLMAARILWDKGVEEFVEAARELQARGAMVRMCLAGEPDVESPGFVPEAKLRDWDRAGVIEWLGHRTDMPQLLRSVDIGALPTHYNEGLPRFLVEAASSGLPLVATDVAGCRRVVRHGENGLLIPTNDPGALADAIEALVRDQPRRGKMGEASRALVEREFSEAKVTREWIELYGSLAGDPRLGGENGKGRREVG